MLKRKIIFKNGKTYFKTGNRDYFMSDYIVDGLTIRTSCTKCKFRHIPHSADITLGDFWGVDNCYPELNRENKGTSLILVHTEKGKRLLESRDDIFLQQCDLEKAIKGSIDYNKDQCF